MEQKYREKELQRKEFYSSKLFTQLKSRMLALLTQGNAAFLNYERHLEVLSFNLESYLLPGMDDAFGKVIENEDRSIQRTEAQLDAIIILLVKTQDEAWNHTKGM